LAKEKVENSISPFWIAIILYGPCLIICNKSIYITKGSFIMKKFVSFALCLIMLFSLMIPALAVSPEDSQTLSVVDDVDNNIIRSIPHELDGTFITMKNHFDVVIREEPSVSSNKLGTLYQGDTVYIVNYWYYEDFSYMWAKIVFGTIEGYVPCHLLG